MDLDNQRQTKMIYLMTAFFLNQANASELWWAGYAIVLIIEVVFKKQGHNFVIKVDKDER